MKKKNGFTLVELMAVIVLIALIMTIAIPNVLRLAANTKNKAYLTKIDLIESAGESLGNDNLGTIKDATGSCSFDVEADQIVRADYKSSVPSTSENGRYPCVYKTVEDLVKSGRLEWDAEEQCSTKDICNDKYQDYVVLNPIDNSVINKCYVYIYYKYNRVYAYFDKTQCDIAYPCPQGTVNCVPKDTDGYSELGHNYKAGYKSAN